MLSLVAPWAVVAVVMMMVFTVLAMMAAMPVAAVVVMVLAMVFTVLGVDLALGGLSPPQGTSAALPLVAPWVEKMPRGSHHRKTVNTMEKFLAPLCGKVGTLGTRLVEHIWASFEVLSPPAPKSGDKGGDTDMENGLSPLVFVLYLSPRYNWGQYNWGHRGQSGDNISQICSHICIVPSVPTFWDKARFPFDGV